MLRQSECDVRPHTHGDHGEDPGLDRLGKAGQMAIIWARSESAGGKIAVESMCEEGGSNVGTASFGPCRKSLVLLVFTSSGPAGRA